jgi:N-methylhydantoinase A
MGLIKVGPESAAADPGPVCYARGGARATLTDANLVLGYLNPDYFNAGAMRLDKAAAADAIKHQIGVALGLEEGEAAWGVHAMANANMERAMRIVSVERGRDPRRYALIAFGGAGPLHAARLALRLGIPKVIVPFGAGVGSAIGMLEANAKVDAALTRRLAVAPGAEAPIAEIYRTLEGRVRVDMRRSGAVGDPTITRFAFMRYAGQGHEIRVDLPDLPGNAAQIAALARRFEAAYRAKYGYCQPGSLIEAVDWYAVGSLAHGRAGTHRARSWRQRASARERATRKAYFPELGGFQDCSVIDRAALKPGEIVRAPAIIEEAEATTLLPPHTMARVSAHGHLVLTVAEG